MTTNINAYSAANAVTAMQNRTTNTYGIKDTADNIEVNWNAIFGAGSPYSSVTVSDTNAPISISGTQYNAALKNNPNVMASNLKTMTSNTASANYAGLTVTGISDAKTLAAAVGDSHVTQIKVQMSVADIKKSLTTLTSSSKIAANGITATPTSPASTPQLDLTYAQFKALGGTDTGVIASTSALSKFSGFNFAITDATVAQAGSLTIGGVSKISSVAIKDSGANIQAALTDTTAGAPNKLTKLQALGTNLKSLTQTDTSKSIQLTYTQFGTANAVSAGSTDSVMKKLATSSKLSIGNNTTALTSAEFGTLVSAVNTNKNVLAAVTVVQGSVLSVAYDQYQQIKNGIKAQTSLGFTDTKNYKVLIVNPTKDSITNPPLTVAQAGALARNPNVASSKVALRADDFSSPSNLNNTLNFLKNVNPDVNFTNYLNESFAQGTLTINSQTLGALATDSKSVGTGATASAISMANAINALNIGGSATGVTAKATATTLNSGLISSTSTTAYAAGDLYINGVAVIDGTVATSMNSAKTATARTALLISAINKDATKTATGVVATAVGTTGYKLTAADGRNIDITSGRTSATGAASALGVDVYGANSSGVGGTAVRQYGNLSLSSTKEITIGGTVTGGGLKAGSYGTSFVGGEVALSYAQYQKLALNSNGTIPSTSPLAKATGVTFKITNATVDQALALTTKATSASSAVSAVSIIDSAANIQAALTDATVGASNKLTKLQALGVDLGSLSQSDPSKSIALTFTQFGAANGSSAGSTPSVLKKLDNSSKLTLGSNASALTAANLTTALSAASLIEKTISNVTVAHDASLTLTQDQYQKLGSGLKATTTGGAAYTVNDFTVTISDKVSIASANSLLNDKKVASVVVGDDNADLADSSTLQDVIKLSANAKVQSIALGTTAESSSPMQLTYAQYTSKGGAVGGTITASTHLSKLSTTAALTSTSIGGSANTYTDGDLFINGTKIITSTVEGSLNTAPSGIINPTAGQIAADRTTKLIAAINALSTTTKVSATAVGLVGFKLTADAGYDIQVTSNRSNTPGAGSALGFNVHGATSGAAATAVTAKQLSFDITDASIDQAIGTTTPTTLSGLTVGSAGSKINSVSIKDTGANIKAALIDTTATTGKLAKLTAFSTGLGSIAQTDPTVPIAMTASQFTAATNPVMAKLDPSTKLSFGDNTTPLTAANFATLLPSLEANKNTVGTITLTHNAAITLSYAQYQQLGSRISAQISASSDKPTDLGISISSAISPEQASALLAGDSRITSVKVADAITHALGTQENLASTIALSNNSKVTMTLTDSLDASDVSQIANYGSQLSQLGNRVTAVQSTATGLTSIIAGAMPNVTSIVVSDSRANLISHISDISNASITSKLASTNPFAVTDLDTTTPIELSATNFQTDKTFSNASNAAYASGSLFKINGSTITLAADGLSKVGGTASGTSSALSVATAINATNSGVLATASTTQDSGSIIYSSNTDYSADDLFINGINIIDSTLASSLNNATSAAARTTLLINAINTKTLPASGAAASTATGVVATANGAIGYTLSAADGRNIDITSDRSSSTGAVDALGFNVSGSSSVGVGGAAITKYGSVRLVSAAPVGISGSGMGGDLVAGTYATKNPTLLSALGTLKLTSVGAADAKTVATNTAVSQIAVNDSLSNVVANATNLAASATLNKIQSITLTPNNPAISINNSDFSADLKSVLAKVSTSSYSIALKGLDLAAAGGYNFNLSPVTEHISSVSATATRATIQAAFDTSKSALKTLGDRLASITITGDANSASTPNLVVTKSDFDTYHDLLSKVSGLKISVTGVAATDATTVAGDVNINVVDVKVVDTAANIRTNFTALNSVALGGTVSSTGTPTIVTAGKLSQIASSNGNVNVSTAQYASGRSAVERLLQGSDKLVVEGTVAETLAIITDDVAKQSFAAPVSGYSISDALKINNVAIVATGASLAGDTTSWVAGTQETATAGTGKSAKAMAAAINLKTSDTKVTAAATTATESGVITSAGATDYTVAGGDLYINKQQIIDATLAVALNSTLTATGRTTLLINAINANSSSTGVTAARIGTTNSYSLNAADGRNIDITSNSSSSAVSRTGFAVSGATAGVSGTAVTKYGSLTLTSTVLASTATVAVPASITVSGATSATNGLADGTWAADALVDTGVLVSVTDTASNIKDNLSALLTENAKVTDIAVSSSDTNKVTISSAQFFTDYAALMPKIAGGVVVTGVKADDTDSGKNAAAVTKLNGSTVRSFTVTDSASEITENLARLSSYATGSSAKLTAISETDNTPEKITVPTLSAVSQYKDALKLVKDINNQNAGLTITDMSA